MRVQRGWTSERPGRDRKRLSARGDVRAGRRSREEARVLRGRDPRVSGAADASHDEPHAAPLHGRQDLAGARQHRRSWACPGAGDGALDRGASRRAEAGGDRHRNAGALVVRRFPARLAPRRRSARDRRARVRGVRAEPAWEPAWEPTWEPTWGPTWEPPALGFGAR